MQTKEEQPDLVPTAARSTAQPKALEIRREFQVPVAHRFKPFTTAEALKAWWWPNGLHADRIDLDFREGGRYFISMKGQVQGRYASGGMTGEFEEIVERAHHDDGQLRGRKGTRDLSGGCWDARPMAGTDLDHV